MSLVAGTRLGPYEIQSAIGVGGMGQVYKARDTRLDRPVAIKVLPTELNADPDRRTRFEREAKAIAGLSHPHICTLHDVGTHDGVTYLVMEHIQGETLADRLLKGRLPLDQALSVAAEIADALTAAHRQGIIHRDLKPGNVMLTTGGAGRSGTVSAKLVDFGLAKLVRHGERPALVSETNAAAGEAPVTARGTILGTLQYMAPEQLEGNEADARTDLWALGAILYEMVTGRRAFEADSDVSLIGAILNADPPGLAALHPPTPASLDRLVRKCLAKRPDDRWDSAHDVADELRWVIQSSSTTASPGPQASGRRRALRTAALAALVLGAAIMGAVLMWLRQPSATSAGPLMRVTVGIVPADELNAGGINEVHLPTPGGSRTALAWTPDGRTLLFVGRHDGVQQLYVRRLDAEEAHPVTGTEGAQVPAVSADGQWAAFWTGGAIKKVPLAGGPATELAPGVGLPPYGMAWGPNGTLFFAHSEDGRIWEADGAAPARAVTTLHDGEVRHALPWPLPDNSGVLYTVRKRRWTWGDEEVVAQRLPIGERKVILRDAEDARYLPSGHLVFLRQGVLFGVPFDLKLFAVSGEPIALLHPVAQALTSGNYHDISGAGQFAISRTGTLAWLSGPTSLYRQSTVVAMDRRGAPSTLPLPVSDYAIVRASPDGRRLAVSVYRPTEQGLWVYELARGVSRVLAQGGEVGRFSWMPDGQRLVYVWLKDGRFSTVIHMADGSRPPVELLPAEAGDVSSITPDGEHIALAQKDDLLMLTLDASGRGRVAPWLQTPNIEAWPEFSPDGRWLAYASNETGHHEVYVRSFPGPGGAIQVSITGGFQPAWHPNGRELFFLSPSGTPGRMRMMVATWEAGRTPRTGTPKMLFEFARSEYQFACVAVRCYDVAPDGQRFYVVQTGKPPRSPVVKETRLVHNWLEELKAKVPAGGAK